MYYVITKGGEGVRKWQFLITFSTESNHKGEKRGGQKTPNHDYVIYMDDPYEDFTLTDFWLNCFIIIASKSGFFLKI